MKATGRMPASPRARRAMCQRGLNPGVVRGTGPGGRIVEADVLRTVVPVSPLSQTVERSGVSVVPSPDSLSPMRRAVAAKVAESFATVPHIYLRSVVDVTTLVRLREEALETLKARCGVRASLTDFLLRALVLALGDCPEANRIWHRGTIVELPEIGVGLVVQQGDGLLVPIIHRADRLELPELIRRRAAVVEAVRSGRTTADLFQGGATSLSNLGKRRVDEFLPIISPPQSSMLGVGRVAERPVALRGRLCPRQTVHLTLSVDHRVMDGAPAAAFLERIVELLESPLLLLYNTRSPNTPE